MSIRITGVMAEVRYGYYPAAVLGPWTLTERTVTATVQSADTFRVSQRPLTFEIPGPGGRWRVWPVEALQIVGSSLTATLGPRVGSAHAIPTETTGDGHDSAQP